MTDENHMIADEHNELLWQTMPEFEDATVKAIYGFTRDKDQEFFSGVILGFEDGRAVRILPEGNGDMLIIDVQEVDEIVDET